MRFLFITVIVSEMLQLKTWQNCDTRHLLRREEPESAPWLVHHVTDHYKNAQFLWHNTFAQAFGKPFANPFDLIFGAFQHHNRWIRAIEYRNRTAPFLGIAVDVGQFGGQQTVSLPSDLV